MLVLAWKYHVSGVPYSFIPSAQGTVRSSLESLLTAWKTKQNCQHCHARIRRACQLTAVIRVLRWVISSRVGLFVVEAFAFAFRCNPHFGLLNSHHSTCVEAYLDEVVERVLCHLLFYGSLNRTSRRAAAVVKSVSCLQCYCVNCSVITEATVTLGFNTWYLGEEYPAVVQVRLEGTQI